VKPAPGVEYSGEREAGRGERAAAGFQDDDGSGCLLGAARGTRAPIVRGLERAPAVKVRAGSERALGRSVKRAVVVAAVVLAAVAGWYACRSMTG